MVNVILSSFLEGFTGGSLFYEARRPEAPTQVFADDGSDCPQENLVSALVTLQHIENAIKEPDHLFEDGVSAMELQTALDEVRTVFHEPRSVHIDAAATMGMGLALKAALEVFAAKTKQKVGVEGENLSPMKMRDERGTP